ncbi:MAG: glycosyltransferase family 2 protein [Bdellovibrionales bacterium]|nr:glycosyltransferase family 2 protein [Bdellovibrionales bacterium]
MSEIKVSLVVITKNEAANIERCLRSAAWVNETIVLDSKSTDTTVAKAQALGAKVFVEDFRGFREQKARAVSLASNDWILALDADEVLSAELSAELQALLKSDHQLSAVRIPRLSFHLGRWIRFGGWYPDLQTRFFDRRRAEWVGGEVHEKVHVKEGAVVQARAPLQHFVFDDLSDQVDTNNLYSTKGAQDLIRSGKSFSLLKLILKPWGKFIETYFWKQGFRDGMPGFIIAVGAAYSLFLKFAKHWEHEMKKQRGKS